MHLPHKHTFYYRNYYVVETPISMCTPPNETVYLTKVFCGDRGGSNSPVYGAVTILEPFS